MTIITGFGHIISLILFCLFELSIRNRGGNHIIESKNIDIAIVCFPISVLLSLCENHIN
jgi:hypothetical protein